jgi:hypothetical protein
MGWPQGNTPSAAQLMTSPYPVLQIRASSTGSWFATGLTALALLASSAPTGIASDYDFARSSGRL